MKTKIALCDLRTVITADNAAKVASGDSCKELLAELNGELVEEGFQPLDPRDALPLLKNALRRLHQIIEKRRLAWASFEITKNLLKDFVDDTNSSQEDGGELYDYENDWCVIRVNEGLDLDAQNAEFAFKRLELDLWFIR